MTPCNRNRRASAWSAALILLVGAGGLASCGSSSKKPASPLTNANASASAPAQSTPSTPLGSPAAGNGGTAGPAGTTGSKTGTATSTKAKPAATNPSVRASKFVVCMRAHDVTLPDVTGSKGSATLNLKGVDIHSAAYKHAIAACARELLGTLSTHLRNGKKIHLKGIHVTGIKLKSIHIGHIEVPNLHVHVGTLPGIKIKTPLPNVGGGESGEPPTQPKTGATG